MLDWQRVKARANGDDEFRIHARFWDSVVKLGVGDASYRMTVASGQITEIEPWFATVACNLATQAPEDDWDALLESIPKPFYQDLYPATVHHGFDVVGDAQHYCAYFPAIRRLVEIMREVKNA